MSTSMKEVFPFLEVQSRNISDKDLNDRISELLGHNGGACYRAMEPYLISPGVTGSRSFDQANAVTVLLQHDLKTEGKYLTQAIANTPRLNQRILWDKLTAVLRKTGYRFKHGRLIGVIDDVRSSDDDDDFGQPDID